MRWPNSLSGAAGAVLSVGLARRPAPTVTTAGASQPSQPGTPQDFLAAARAQAFNRNGSGGCWRRLQRVRQLWNQHASVLRWLAGLVRDHPQLNHRPSGSFLLAAYDDLCPVPGA